MESQEEALNTGQQAIINTQIRNVFLWNRRSQKGQINNATYDPIEYPEGTVMGRIATSGLLVPFTSGASNGSQDPIGVLIRTYTVDDGTTADVEICDDGDVNGSGLIFQGSDTLNTVVSGKRVIDRLKANGLKVITTTEMGGDYDNQ